MSTTIRIGRLEATADRKVQGLGRRRNQVTISGLLLADGLGSSEWQAEQLAALLGNPGEPVVPLVWGGTSAADVPVTGLYRVVDAQATGAAPTAGAGVHTYSLTLERTSSYANPRVELTVLGGPRVGRHAAITAPQALLGLPGSASLVEAGVNTTMSSAVRQAEGGEVRVLWDPTFDILTNARPWCHISPADWYVGAATLLVDGRVVVGRQVPARPTGWQISNGLVRLTAAPGTSGITVERWSGSAWGVPRVLTPGINTGPGAALGDLPAPSVLTVLRNSPEEVAIELGYDVSSLVPGATFEARMTISLRRGQRIAAFEVSSRGGYAYQVDVADWGSTVGTTLSGGRTLSTAVWAFDEQTLTTVAASGKPSGTRRGTGESTGRLAWGFGYGPGSGVDAPQAVVNQWGAFGTDRMQVVPR